jgi:hypothetical protein
MSETQAQPIEDAVSSNPELIPIYKLGIGTLYKVGGE